MEVLRKLSRPRRKHFFNCVAERDKVYLCRQLTCGCVVAVNYWVAYVWKAELLVGAWFGLQLALRKIRCLKRCGRKFNLFNRSLVKGRVVIRSLIKYITWTTNVTPLPCDGLLGVVIEFYLLLLSNSLSWNRDCCAAHFESLVFVL